MKMLPFDIAWVSAVFTFLHEKRNIKHLKWSMKLVPA